MQEWAAFQRAGPCPPSPRLLSTFQSSSGAQWQPKRSRCRTAAKHVVPCCMDASYSAWHSASCCCSSSSRPGPIPVHHVHHHYEQPSSRSVACHALTSGHHGVPQQCSSQHKASYSSTGGLYTPSASLNRNVSCSSSSPQSSCSPARQRSVRTAAASLALVGPTTAAVASAASVSATSFSLSKVLAVVLGYAVMAGSLFRSVPQIVKVLQHQSTEGLSLTSVIVELCCYSITIAYNLTQGYGFNTFGEVCACWAQDIVLIALIFRFSNTRKWVAAVTGISVALGSLWLLSPSCPHNLLAALQASNIITMALGSRLPQIILNMRRGNAGVLSVTTCLLNVAGNAARVFTTIVLTGDMLILAGVLSQGTLNTILLCQSIGTARQHQRAAAAVAPAQADVLSSPGKVHGPQAGPDSGPAGAPAGGFIMQPAT